MKLLSGTYLIPACLILVSCESKKYKYEDEICSCWAKVWLEKREFPQEEMEEGMELLDKHLAENGMLDLADGADYVHFAEDTTQIVVPANTSGFTKMKLAFEGNTSDTNRNFGLYCITQFVDDRVKNLDPDELMFRLMVFSQLAIGQNYPLNGFKELFNTFTKEEMKHPIVRFLFYYMIYKSEFPKISFGKRKNYKFTYQHI